MGSIGYGWGLGRFSARVVEETVKFGGGNVMFWGYMLWEGMGTECKIDGSMDAHLYTQILQDELPASLEEYGKTPEDVIFQ